MVNEKYPPITLKDAEKLTLKWREYYASLLSAFKNEQNKESIGLPTDPNGKDIFRGFNIPLSDLENLLEVAKKYNKDREKSKKINAVRAYLALGEATTSAPAPLHLLLLPITKTKDEVDPKGKDLFEIEDNQSAIYDFTTPCPDICDIESPLYKS